MPLMRVIHSSEREGRGSFLGPDTTRRTRWYELTLECGHVVERTMKYKPRTGRKANGWHPRSIDDALPPPRRAQCSQKHEEAS
jgi:hypothetical protein